MKLFCFTAEALCSILVKKYFNPEIGYIVGFVRARSQMEALNAAMTEIMDCMHVADEWTSDEMAATWSETYGSITVLETGSGKIINHIQKIAVHEC
ncbi:MAG: hypothetical protein II412_07215 [Clostridia bacterium]|nr:hypothetical protein [Clostridia bacterium]